MASALGAVIKRVWQHPLVREVDVNDEHTVEVHRRMIQSKPLLYRHYLRWYRECMPACEAARKLGGPIVEIGSGAGFLEDFVPGLVKTEVVPTPYTSRVLDAMNMDFADGEVSAFFLIGVFHHIPDPARFLSEAQRCLKPGGRLVMIEPTNNRFQRFLARYLNHYEYYDDTVADWITKTEGRMTQANLALSHVVFFRDRARFEREFPRLSIHRVRYHTFLSYILSGGMTFRSFLPGFAGPAVDLLEWMARPFMKKLGTGMTLELIKQEA